MKPNLLTVVIFVVLLTSCSASYDYAGSYEVADGVDCGLLPGKNDLITISPAITGEKVYMARLSSQLSMGGTLPLESEPAELDEDGSITFAFFKVGKTGLFSVTPSVDMKIKLIQKDKDHIYVTSWPVVATAPSIPSLGAYFDFVNDAEISVLGRTTANTLSPYVSDKGLCLKKTNI